MSRVWREKYFEGNQDAAVQHKFLLSCRIYTIPYQIILRMKYVLQKISIAMLFYNSISYL